MRNLKRVLSLALALIMVLGLMVMTGSAASADFDDAAEISYTEAVDVLTGLGVLEGDDTGSFNPTQVLTREQAAKIICYLVLGVEDAEKVSANHEQIFVDVAADRWSAGFIAYCSNLGYICGDGNGYYRPEDELTGVAFSKLLLVALGYDSAVEGYEYNPEWATNIAVDAIDAGIDLKGVLLSAPLTREQAAQMALQTLQANTVEYEFKGVEVLSSDGTVVRTGVKGPYAVKAATGAVDYDGSKDGIVQLCEKYYPKLVKFQGVITANEYADLYSDLPLKAGKTEIDGVIYNYSSDLTIIGESRQGWANGADVLFIEDTGTNVIYDNEGKAAVLYDGKKDNFKSVTGLTNDAEEFIDFDRADENKYETDIRIVYDTDPDDNVDPVSIRAGATLTQTQYDEIKSIFTNDNLETGWVVVGTKYNAATAEEDDISNDITFKSFVTEYLTAITESTTSVDGATNGEWLKVIDNDADGKADYVLLTRYALDEIYDSTTKKNETSYEFYDLDTKDWTPVYLTDVEVGDVVLYTLIDGNAYVQKADVVTATIQTVSYKNETITTTDGDTYEQSGIGNVTEYADVITEIDEKVEYNLYLDKYGYVRAYDEVDGTSAYALLTEIYTTNQYNNKYVKNSISIAEYTIGDAKTAELPISNAKNNVFFEAADGLKNELLEATNGLGVKGYVGGAKFESKSTPGIYAITNVADYTLGDETIGLYTAAVQATDRAGKLTGKMAVDYIQIDDTAKIAAKAVKYPVVDTDNNNGYVNATHATEYYLVTDKGITYFTDYANVPAIKAEYIDVAYAVATNTTADASKDDYWVADVIVIELNHAPDELYDSVALVYYNNSKTTAKVKNLDSLDNKTPEEVTSFYINDSWADQWNDLAFYEIYNDSKDADLRTITEIVQGEYNAHGIYAGTIDRIESVSSKGDYIVLTDGTVLYNSGVPVWSVTANKNGTVVSATETSLTATTYKSDNSVRKDGNEGDDIIYVYDGKNLAYIILVDTTDANNKTTYTETYGLWEEIDEEQRTPTAYEAAVALAEAALKADPQVKADLEAAQTALSALKPQNLSDTEYANVLTLTAKIELAASKANAVAAVDKLVEESGYGEDEGVKAAADALKTAINGAEDAAALKAVLDGTLPTALNDAIAAAEAAAKALAEAKDAAKAAIDEQIAGYTDPAVLDAAQAVKDAIDAAETVEEVDAIDTTALNEAIAAADKAASIAAVAETTKTLKNYIGRVTPANVEDAQDALDAAKELPVPEETLASDKDALNTAIAELEAEIKAYNDFIALPETLKDIAENLTAENLADAEQALQDAQDLELPAYATVEQETALTKAIETLDNAIETFKQNAADEEAAAAEALAAAKDAAKEDIDERIAGYTDQDVLDAAQAVKDAIEAAETVEEVEAIDTTALDEAIAAADQAAADAEAAAALDAAKEAAKDAIDERIADYADDQDVLDAAQAVKNAIDAAESVEEVEAVDTSALDEAIAAVDNLEAIREAGKATVDEKIQGYEDNKGVSEAAQALKDAIDAAETEEKIKEILLDEQDLLDAIAAADQLEEDRANALEAVDGQIDGYTNQAVLDAADALKDAINAAEDAEELEEATSAEGELAQALAAAIDAADELAEAQESAKAALKEITDAVNYNVTDTDKLLTDYNNAVAAIEAAETTEDVAKELAAGIVTVQKHDTNDPTVSNADLADALLDAGLELNDVVAALQAQGLTTDDIRLALWRSTNNVGDGEAIPALLANGVEIPEIFDVYIAAGKDASNDVAHILKTYAETSADDIVDGYVTYWLTAKTGLKGVDVERDEETGVITVTITDVDTYEIRDTDLVDVATAAGIATDDVTVTWTYSNSDRVQTLSLSNFVSQKWDAIQNNVKGGTYTYNIIITDGTLSYTIDFVKAAEEVAP